MKSIYVITIIALLITTISYSQTKIKVKDDQIFVNNVYSFDVIMRIQLGNLQPGEWRDLSEDELEVLFGLLAS